jgi:hypothetical protein
MKLKASAQQKKQFREEIAYRMRENLCQLSIQEGTNVQNIWEFKKLNTKRTETPINRWEN